MTQFSLVEAIGSRTNRLVLGGVGLAIVTPLLFLIPLDAAIDPAPGREPASALWLVAGVLLAAVCVGALARLAAALRRVVAAVCIAGDDLLVEGLLDTRTVPLAEITGLAEGAGQGPHSTLIVEGGSKAWSIDGDEGTLLRIADAIGRRNPRVAFGPWARVVRTGRRAPDDHVGETAHFLFLRKHRAGLRLQAIGSVVLALTVSLTVMAVYDKAADAMVIGHGPSWKKLLAQTAGTFGTLAALVAGLGTSILAVTVTAGGRVRFAKLWSAVEVSAADVRGISEPPRGKDPRLVVQHANRKLTVSGDAAELERLAGALQHANPGLEAGPWRLLFAEAAGGE